MLIAVVLFLAALALMPKRGPFMPYKNPAVPQTGLEGDCCFRALYNCMPWWRRRRVLSEALAWHKQHAAPVSQDHRARNQPDAEGGVYLNDARKIYCRAGLRQFWVNLEEKPVSPAKITKICRAAGGSGIALFDHHACAFRAGVWRSGDPPHDRAFIKEWGLPAEIWAAPALSPAIN